MERNQVVCDAGCANVAPDGQDIRSGGGEAGHVQADAQGAAVCRAALGGRVGCQAHQVTSGGTVRRPPPVVQDRLGVGGDGAPAALAFDGTTHEPAALGYASTVRVTLPNGRSSTRWRSASGACSSGKDRSWAGVISPLAISGRTAAYASACSSADAANSENPLTWAR